MNRSRVEHRKRSRYGDDVPEEALEHAGPEHGEEPAVHGHVFEEGGHEQTRDRENGL